MKLTLEAARELRDGGIDAMAALNQGLVETLAHLPEELHTDVKRAVGRIMGEVVLKLINAATEAFPELEPSDETWLEVVKSRR